MFSSCLTCPVAPPSGSVRLPAMSSVLPSLVLCLLASCHLVLFCSSRLSNRRAGRLAMRRRLSACDELRRMWRRSVCYRCSRFARRPVVILSPRFLDTGGGAGTPWCGRCCLLLSGSCFVAIVSWADGVGCLVPCCSLVPVSFAVLLGRFRLRGGAQFLWIASVAVAGAASPWYIVIVS